MIGLVLCGGNSSRMGQDKGLLLRNKITWAAHAYNVLTQLSIPTYVSVNPHQQEQYSAIFSPAYCIVDRASLQVHGPVLGLLTAHLQHPAKDILVLACDMPLMQHDAIAHLLAHYSNHSVVYTNNNHIEPLCGIYTATSLAHLVQYFSVGEDTTPIGQLVTGDSTAPKVKKHSMMHCLELISAKYIDVPNAYTHYFTNMNTVDDLLL